MANKIGTVKLQIDDYDDLLIFKSMMLEKNSHRVYVYSSRSNFINNTGVISYVTESDALKEITNLNLTLIEELDRLKKLHSRIENMTFLEWFKWKKSHK